jgi:hypothetical protein
MRKGARFTSRCPRCQASAGAPCRDKDGNPMPGVHFQRKTELRRAIDAAFYLYAPPKREREATE